MASSWTARHNLLKLEMVPETGLEPVQHKAEGFSYHFGFRRQRGAVRGLEHAFTMTLRL